MSDETETRRRIHLRDRIACAVANFALNYIASAWYRKMIGGSIRYGLAGAARDAAEDRPAPPWPIDGATYTPLPGDHRGRTTSP